MKFTNWRKSSYSSGGNGTCVEVAGGITVVGVRDSKDRAGGTIIVGERSWRAFVTGVIAS